MVSELQSLLSDYIPSDHASQFHSSNYISLCSPGDRVLDLGCGSGQSMFDFPDFINWYGVDIEDNRLIWNNLQQRNNADFLVFDGINIPYPNDYFNIIYCNQVLEHVFSFHALLTDVYRVLKSGGYFLGSLSYLEPFHSLSYCNFTPYGFKTYVELSGFKLIELRPGIDSFSLILSKYLNIPLTWWDNSPLNRLVDLMGRIKGWDVKRINAVKLQVCGCFCFKAMKV